MMVGVFDTLIISMRRMERFCEKFLLLPTSFCWSGLKGQITPDEMSYSSLSIGSISHRFSLLHAAYSGSVDNDARVN